MRVDVNEYLYVRSQNFWFRQWLLPTYNIEVVRSYTYPSFILDHLNDRGNAAFFSSSYYLFCCRGHLVTRNPWDARATNVIVWGYVWGYIASVEKCIAWDRKQDWLKRNVLKKINKNRAVHE